VFGMCEKPTTKSGAPLMFGIHEMRDERWPKHAKLSENT